jgi:hypothetical protein
LAPLLPCWMRPGRMRSSSSRVVIAALPLPNKDDGARDIEMVEELARCASKGGCRYGQKA